MNSDSLYRDNPGDGETAHCHGNLPGWLDVASESRTLLKTLLWFYLSQTSSRYEI